MVKSFTVSMSLLPEPYVFLTETVCFRREKRTVHVRET